MTFLDRIHRFRHRVRSRMPQARDVTAPSRSLDPSRPRALYHARRAMSLSGAALLIGAILLAAFALIEALPVCADTDESDGARPVIELADVTARTGITFEHVAGSVEKDWIAEVNGSGVALFDFDGDGDLDIYFVNCGGSFEDALAARESAGREA
ncbi:MAG TPA: hypothetical protein VK116_19405, partial [Planctomycetota bacterium]|nr:hypothetical protein [Planctomycetota bacterium]